MRTTVTIFAIVAIAAGVTGVLTLGQDRTNADEHDESTMQALLVTGGCCHDYKTQKGILTEGIAERLDVEWTVVHEGGNAKDHKISIFKKDDWAADYDVVLYNMCFGAVKDSAFIKGVVEPHKTDGVGAVALHCTMHTFRSASTDVWDKFLGVRTSHHEGKRPLDVERLNSNHPVMAGFPKQWTTPNGELYKIKGTYDSMTPLAKAYGEDTERDHTVIWTNTYGKGRVFGTTLGHHNSTMRHDTYLDLVARGMKWAAK